MAKYMPTLELSPRHGNLVTQVHGILKIIMARRHKGNQCLPHFEDVFVAFKSFVKIDPVLEDYNVRGEFKGQPKWQEAIRNAHATKYKTPKNESSSISRGEIISLKDGGFALPGSVPKGRKVVKVRLDKAAISAPFGNTKVKKKNKKREVVHHEYAKAKADIDERVSRVRRLTGFFKAICEFSGVDSDVIANKMLSATRKDPDPLANLDE